MPFARLAATVTIIFTAMSMALAQPPPKPSDTPVAGVPAVVVPAPAEAPGAGRQGGSMQRFPGVWVEGPGYQVTYGDTYDSCARKCLAQSRCVMIEFYRPEKKCNLYDTVRPKLKGGSSDVAVRG